METKQIILRGFCILTALACMVIIVLGQEIKDIKFLGFCLGLVYILTLIWSS